MSTTTTATEVRLASRPEGWPTAADFEVVDTEVPSPGPGQLLVRNLEISVDPYMRGRMKAAKSYVEPYKVGEAMLGGAIGEVVESTVDEFRPGDIVLHGLGWRTHAVVDARQATKVDPDAAPLSAYLGVLGMTGLTAYAGLLDVAQLKEGDTVFVSGAAGAVGSVAGQLAKLKGAERVIGSAGSDEKVRHLIEDLGFDAAFNYKNGPVADQLAEAAPDGIDVYFDNVGGEHLEAAIGNANLHARFAICGMISAYNATEPPAAPRNLGMIVGKRLTLRGFLVGDHLHLRERFLAEIAPLVRDGRLRHHETVVEGIRNAPQAFLDMLAGANTGKMLVRL
ncbi:NADP-dependent oxidoreductase [Amycolatopsis acidiphila]|uniref:NADP-dependent oxidoreductase n=1 Tax=Amycolatopsis acidiphila TaxID=715473 RepID=A0A558AN77_9PSEU|nr:NADP-dependent oxidoreductase [Amycolatopsis acidiphila]TVT25717.1 NADP-dependent oxidoreductase [Amycolatopsis acidiphila]UIJ60477.1 NADP-dependent oxidoreductase [Amycolatopsis acidiphila]GHG82669.1 NADP-dependent oxidoreductase [Amycolatopsis acidiphila]